MGRKQKRRAPNAEPPEEQADQEMAGEDVVVDDADDFAANPPTAVLDECEEEDEEDIKGLLEPFSRDELLDLLAEACLRDPALLSRLAASAASDAVHRRLFVHGLGPGATPAALAAVFAAFGALDECHAVVDRATGRCRGYGFVTFRRRSAARRALADASERVGGRPIACQLASLGPAPVRADRKLFVDKVPASASHDDLRRFFSAFGDIEAGPLGADRATGQFRRGYAIFLYESAEGLTKALEEPRKVFNGCELQCRRAHRVAKKKRAATAAPADAGGHSNGAVAAALPTVQPKRLLTSAAQPLLGSSSNQPVVSSSTVLFCQNARAGGTGLLGASTSAAVVPPSPGQSTPGSHSGAVQCSRLSSMDAPTSTSQAGQGSTRQGLIQRYLGR